MNSWLNFSSLSELYIIAQLSNVIQVMSTNYHSVDHNCAKLIARKVFYSLRRRWKCKIIIVVIFARHANCFRYYWRIMTYLLATVNSGEGVFYLLFTPDAVRSHNLYRSLYLIFCCCRKHGEHSVFSITCV